MPPRRAAAARPSKDSPRPPLSMSSASNNDALGAPGGGAEHRRPASARTISTAACAPLASMHRRPRSVTPLSTSIPTTRGAPALARSSERRPEPQPTSSASESPTGPAAVRSCRAARRSALA
eukprot:scaffold38273_cov28-Tisochrysis_lutea.AAC.3